MNQISNVYTPGLGGSTWDGHGGRAEEHRAEMEEITRAVYAEEREKDAERIEERMQEIAADAYRQAVKDFLHALEFDINSIVRLAIEGCRDIFEGKKAQKHISDHIMKTVEKNLRGKSYRRH